MKNFSRTVILLSFVSLFADIASELLYPVLPLYLKSVGMGAVYIGILEGCADLISGISKTFFGKWSDRIGKRLPFVWSGYMLSSFAKASIGIFVNPLWVLFTRSMDRLGKGVRTSSRDAILSMEATPETLGAVFGFHRAMDTTGAFLGPILALIFLKYYPGEYRRLFSYSLIPAIAVAFLLWRVKEKRNEGKKESKNIFFSSMTYWKEASFEYKQVVIIILVFTLSNSSDMFLLLKAREAVNSDLDVIGFYILYNFIYASSSYQIGKWSDVVGKKFVFILGLFLFSAAYFLIGYSKNILGFTLAFILYGLFSASTEGISKAWISSLCKEEDLGVALGFQNTTQSIVTMLASLLAGLVWTKVGSSAVFIMSGTMATLVAIVVVFKFKLNN